jgi:hypothetical protein
VSVLLIENEEKDGLEHNRMGAEEIRNMFQGFSSDIVVYGCYGEILYDKEDPFVDAIVPWNCSHHLAERSF